MAFDNPFDRAVAGIAGPRASLLERSAAVNSVHSVFSQLANPDDEMIATGIRELAEVIPHFKNMPRTFQRRTVECLWRAMLERARN